SAEYNLTVFCVRSRRSPTNSLELCDRYSSTPRAGGTGERVVREPRVPRGPATRSERSERRERRGGCGERATPSPGQDPLAREDARRELCLRSSSDRCRGCTRRLHPETRV